jgi:hypothetical protein
MTSRRALPFLFLVSLAAGMAALGAACAGTDPSSSGEPCTPDLASVQEIFQRSCAQGGCHGATESAAALDLVSPGVESRLVNVLSATCDGQIRVVPGQPDQSFLFAKVSSATPACGTRMPPSGLPDSEQACIEGWIASLKEGASDAGTDAPSCETCGGTTCVTLSSDPAHCGTCANACAPGEFCSAGSCLSDCGTLDPCGGTCADLSSDVANCGACGNVCAAGQTCAAGKCTCGTASVSFATDVQSIFTASCSSAGCHKGVMPQAGLDLSAGKSFADLVDVGASQCNDGRKRVLPGDPAQSYLMDKMMGVDLCSGTAMPKLGSLPTPQLTTIANWICAGAPNN